MQYLYDLLGLDNAIACYSVIFFVVLSSCCGQILVRYCFGTARLKTCHEVGGYYFSVVGTFYAILVGLVIYDAQARFDKARTDVDGEAAALFMINFHAEKMPQPAGSELQDLIQQYTQRVMDYEWDTMKLGHRDDVARALLLEASNKMDEIEPLSQGQGTLYDKMQDELTSVWNMRRERISHVEYRIPDLEWTVLLLGGVVTIFFSYFFVLESQWMQSLMCGLLSLIIASNIYVVAELSNPFAGQLFVPKKPFSVVKIKIAPENFRLPP